MAWEAAEMTQHGDQQQHGGRRPSREGHHHAGRRGQSRDRPHHAHTHSHSTRNPIPIRDTWKAPPPELPVPTSPVAVDIQPLGNWVAPPLGTVTAPTPAPAMPAATMRTSPPGLPARPLRQQQQQAPPPPRKQPLPKLAPPVPTVHSAAPPAVPRPNERVFHINVDAIDAQILKAYSLSLSTRKSLLCSLTISQQCQPVDPAGFMVDFCVVAPQVTLQQVISGRPLLFDADVTGDSSSDNCVTLPMETGTVAAHMRRFYDAAQVANVWYKCSFKVDSACRRTADQTGLVVDVKVVQVEDESAVDLFSAWSDDAADNNYNAVSPAKQFGGSRSSPPVKVVGWSDNTTEDDSVVVEQTGATWNSSPKPFSPGQPVYNQHDNQPSPSPVQVPEQPSPQPMSATRPTSRICENFNNNCCETAPGAECPDGRHVCNFVFRPDGRMCLVDTHKAGLHSFHDIIGAGGKAHWADSTVRPSHGRHGEICKSWNRGECKHSDCRFRHLCITCNSKSHPQLYCPVHCARIGRPLSSRPAMEPEFTIATGQNFCRDWNQEGCKFRSCRGVHACLLCKSPEHKVSQCTATRTIDSFCPLFNVAPSIARGAVDKRGKCINCPAECPKIHACINCEQVHPVRECRRLTDREAVLPGIVRDLKARIIRQHGPNVNPLSPYVPVGLRYNLPLACETFNSSGACSDANCEKPHICDVVVVTMVDGVPQSRYCAGDHAAVNHPDLAAADLLICPDFNNTGRCSVASTGDDENTLRCDKGWHICGNCKVLGHSLRDHHVDPQTKDKTAASLSPLAPYCYEFGMQACMMSAYHCVRLHACEKCWRMGHGMGVCAQAGQSTSFFVGAAVDTNSNDSCDGVADSSHNVQSASDGAETATKVDLSADVETALHKATISNADESVDTSSTLSVAGSESVGNVAALDDSTATTVDLETMVTGQPTSSATSMEVDVIAHSKEADIISVADASAVPVPVFASLETDELSKLEAPTVEAPTVEASLELSADGDAVEKPTSVISPVENVVTVDLQPLDDKAASSAAKETLPAVSSQVDVGPVQEDRPLGEETATESAASTVESPIALTSPVDHGEGSAQEGLPSLNEVAAETPIQIETSYLEASHADDVKAETICDDKSRFEAAEKAEVVIAAETPTEEPLALGRGDAEDKQEESTTSEPGSEGVVELTHVDESNQVSAASESPMVPQETAGPAVETVSSTAGELDSVDKQATTTKAADLAVDCIVAQDSASNPAEVETVTAANDCDQAELANDEIEKQMNSPAETGEIAQDEA